VVTRAYRRTRRSNLLGANPGLARHIVTEATRPNSRLAATVGTDLRGKTLGVLGLGGALSRAIGSAFGMN